MSLEKLEHVSAGLGDCSHLGDDWEVVDDKANLVLLVAGEGLSVAKKTEAYKKNSEIAGEWNFYAQDIQRILDLTEKYVSSVLTLK